MRHIKASFFNLQIKNNFPENCNNDKCPFDISLCPSLLSYSKYNTDNKTSYHQNYCHTCVLAILAIKWLLVGRDLRKLYIWNATTGRG